MTVYTIGFTQTSAEKFFSLLRLEKVKRLIDVRLNNVSQLSGFAKKNDLKFFLATICDADYIHMPELAPTKDILDAYKGGKITWERYQDDFLNLMARRNIEKIIKPDVLEDGCLLCSEHKPHMCHRRLVVEYLKEHGFSDLKIKHLY